MEKINLDIKLYYLIFLSPKIIIFLKFPICILRILFCEFFGESIFINTLNGLIFSLVQNLGNNKFQIGLFSENRYFLSHKKKFLCFIKVIQKLLLPILKGLKLEGKELYFCYLSNENRHHFLNLIVEVEFTAVKCSIPGEILRLAIKAIAVLVNLNNESEKNIYHLIFFLTNSIFFNSRENFTSIIRRLYRKNFNFFRTLSQQFFSKDKTFFLYHMSQLEEPYNHSKHICK
ncbi:hypothetical protein BpHYR1_050768 [Brachionus plicatilis]|uniref:Uncharacterized protein n=1 Tax=Brachionus plicatilis TaxID=10195 RepID=A0A3M7P9G3_BRAPC|nr:hypothetical protein BpHYR1_050768 [Brachionus plicatilis]